ncbi:hypothetical protein RQP46_005114 [Phenoliferia psychrophenolica]
MSASQYYNSSPYPQQPQQPPHAYGGDQQKGWGNAPQGGYYPQQQQFNGPPQGYYPQGQPNMYAQQPQAVYVQQRPQNDNSGCLACCAGMAACCCLEELCLF